LTDWRQATVALVYGRPRPGGWGTLGLTSTADNALYRARSYADRVDQWNGARPVVVALNPNAVMAGRQSVRDLYLHYLIAEARRQGYYVMLDVQTGDRDPLPLFSSLMDDFLQENVWFDWDIEHTAGGSVEAAQINEVAEHYFERRRAAGYESPGVFTFFVFNENQVGDPAGVRRVYGSGEVVPIFDGFGGEEKLAKTRRVLALFGPGPYGIMEFETRWGARYDRISAQRYFETFPDAQIFASQ